MVSPNLYSEILMFYNVENFYPPQNIYPLSGLYNWDDYKYRQKVRKITNVFRFILDDYGKLPSIIGFAEIGDLSVLKDLTKEKSPLNGYRILYNKSDDLRGLSVSMLFDQEKYSLLSCEFLKFEDNGDTIKTRDILHAEMESENGKIHIFVLHLPSQREQNKKQHTRNYICSELHKILFEIYNQQESFIIMGDFNENPNSDILKSLQIINNKKILINPFEALFEKNTYSCYHGSKGLLFDQMFVSYPFQYNIKDIQNIEPEIYKHPQLRKTEKNQNYYPVRTYSGSRYLGGYSDHFPILLHLKKNHS